MAYQFLEDTDDNWRGGASDDDTDDNKTIVEKCKDIKDFNVSIYNPDDGARTIVLGDIHADLEALIYCLRDCAKVIDENNNWIGKATHVVLVGDMIDRARRQDIDMLTVVDGNDDYKGVGEIEDEEIIIQKLLNKLSLQALIAGGRIIKLLGNHGIGHLNQYGSKWVASYNTNFGLMNEKPGFSPKISGYQTDSKDLFMAGKNRLKNYAPGEDSSGLLMDCGGRMIVKIGKWIIVHGGILPELIKDVYKIFDIDLDDPNRGEIFLEKANEVLRKKYKNELRVKEEDVDAHRRREMTHNRIMRRGAMPPPSAHCVAWNAYVHGKYGLVWDRHLSDNLFNESIICSPDGELQTIFELLGFPSDSKIVVSHTPQKDLGLFHQGGVVWSLLQSPEVEQTNPDATIFGPKGIRCNYNKPNLDNKCPKIPGITYQCPDKNDIGQIWRVDVAMSRGFDVFREMLYAKDAGKIEDYWEGRKPQVLEVIHHDHHIQDEVRVIKSKNHLPRDDDLFENYIETYGRGKYCPLVPAKNSDKLEPLYPCCEWSCIKPEPE